MEEQMIPDEKFHTFEGKTMKLKDLLPMVRGGGYSNYDTGGCDIILRPECEEWTHVAFNCNSGLLDLLGNLTIESIEAEDNDVVFWVKTDDYNWFKTGEGKA